MSKKMSLLLFPGLALLLSLGSGCKAKSEKSVVADVPAGKTAPGGQQAASPQAGTTAAGPASRQLAPLHLPGAPAEAARPGAPGAPGAAATLPPDKIPAVVARVNGQEIKKSELM